jgi:hypothetical protein
MFPETLLPAESPAAEYEDLKELHRFYEISDVRTWDYNDGGDIGNVIANEEIDVLQGGVMRRIFRTSPLLFKHPLLFLDEKLKPYDMSDHWAGNARIADFTAVFLHYKISANLYELVRREIEEERRYHNLHRKYDRIYKVLAQAPSLLIRNDASKELKSVNDLVGTRFVSVSREYMNFVDEEERRNGNYSEESRSDRLSEAFFNARSEVAAYGQKTSELQDELREVRAETKGRRATLRRARDAEKQLEVIQSSRSWKALTAFKRLRIRARNVLGRLGNGLQREG